MRGVAHARSRARSTGKRGSRNALRITQSFGQRSGRFRGTFRFAMKARERREARQLEQQLGVRCVATRVDPALPERERAIVGTLGVEGGCCPTYPILRDRFCDRTECADGVPGALDEYVGRVSELG